MPLRSTDAAKFAPDEPNGIKWLDKRQAELQGPEPHAAESQRVEGVTANLRQRLSALSERFRF